MGHIRHALRVVGRQPAFSGAVVLMLALGVGGATAMFSIVRAVLLKPLPYERPGELVWMFGSFSQADSAAVSPPDFLDYRARSAAFSSLGAMVIGPQSVTVVHPSGPERLNAATVSAGLITTLGVPLTLGRDFRRDEESGASAVIISDRLWREQFDGAPDVLGQPLRVDERIRTIVGIAPPRFALPFDPFIRLTDPVDLYVPISLDDAEAQVRRFHFLRLIGRLAPGVTLSQAQSQMDVIARQLEAAYPENKTWKLRLLPLHERFVADLRRVLFVLLGAVLVLLLVACSNVAGLLLARGVLRQPEIALRTALGASRRQLVVHLLAEALVLASLGGVAGLMLGSWVVQVLKAIGPADLPRLSEIGIDPVVVAFAPLLGGGRASCSASSRRCRPPAGIHRARCTTVCGPSAVAGAPGFGAGWCSRRWRCPAHCSCPPACWCKACRVCSRSIRGSTREASCWHTSHCRAARMRRTSVPASGSRRSWNGCRRAPVWRRRLWARRPR